jgi:hypothetical protein
MDFDEFKDEVVEAIMENSVKQQISRGVPVYVFGHNKGEGVETGSFPTMKNDLEAYIQTIREINRDEGHDFSALAVFSLVADLKKARNPEEIKDMIENMDGQDMLRFLKEEGLMANSISIRLESLKKSELSAILTFILDSDMEISDHVEIMDTQLSSEQLEISPFGEGLFWR